MEFKCVKCKVVNVIENEEVNNISEITVNCYFCNTLNLLTFPKKEEVKCTKCGSTQIQALKNGFSGSKALLGGLLIGGVGLLAGTIGSNKIKLTCLNCGNIFNPPNS